MGKQKQLVISRFFARKPETNNPPPPSPPPPVSSSPPPKISTTVSFSPAKRKLLSTHLTTTPKKPKLSYDIPTPSSSSSSLHQKFLDKLLEPSSPETSIKPPSSSCPNIKYTPLEQQVVNLKTKYPDVLLMIEVGYKYRFFGPDAQIAATVLGIYAHKDHNFMTASIPTYRLNVHVRRLVSAGYKVGVVKQTETAAIKAHGDNKVGPFCRGLSALYTKATLEAAADVGGGEERCGGGSNYLCCVVDKSESGEFDTRIGFVGVEISTGDVVYGEFSDGLLRSGLEAAVLSLAPAELLLGDPLSKETEKLLLAYAGPSSNVRVERTSRVHLSDGGALAEVMSLYETASKHTAVCEDQQRTDMIEHGNTSLAIEGIMNMPDLAVQALALTISHLKQFGFEQILSLGASFRPFSSNMEMILSGNTLQQLEVLRNNSNGSESGSLLQIMNCTITISGSRLIRHWVAHPLCDKEMISARLDAVSEISESMMSYNASQNVGEFGEEDYNFSIEKPDFYCLLTSVLTMLGKSPDIQRGITRIFHRTATASEFIAVIQAILNAGEQLQRFHIEEEQNNERVEARTVNSVLLRKLILTVSSSSVLAVAAKYLSTLNKKAAENGDMANLIVVSNGQFQEVARSRKEVQLAKSKLESLISLYRKQLRMCRLEFMTVSGITHLIELPADVKVPLSWVKVNSTKKMIRYHPPEVLAALDQSKLANEELMVVCRAAWDSFLRGFAKHYAEFQSVVQALAALDCLHSLATLSKNKNYVRPQFVDDDEPVQIHISSGRHPVLETILQDSFIPNDTHLCGDGEHCQIVTGPNMGGKSCYIRQVALITLMAQVGSFVPASSARLHVLDGIYTRMGASDSIQQGRSTFLEELSEASNILHKCTASSLVIIDELGRGTSTHDGEAIAYATLHHLLEQKRSMVLFVTHYPKIADIKNEFPNSVGAYHVSYLTAEKNGSVAESNFVDEDVTYLYKLVPGVSERSFGFKVAQLAQLPLSCIKRATAMAARLEAVVSCERRNRLDKGQLLKTLSSDQQKNLLGSSDFFQDEKTENHKELSDCYENFFSNLRLALLSGEPGRGFQYLENARSIAKALINR
ncbi:DNA mismatch repair protein MSH3 isoform X2 [Mercurialis annua]|uniref:DNA mismatch repair protein MSH3 isoform X1 n=1 Tax=Mercurialis annua TaxID=3986 RepID=UPI00215F6F01|nr:DNA mismatch repair protein MSH3 isoform X1 [Mercurialis annua]XP_050222034.1 DNA mismatch repair protein MSH3 isoform X2 [Mercurialis annua]